MSSTKIILQYMHLHILLVNIIGMIVSNRSLFHYFLWKYPFLHWCPHFQEHKTTTLNKGYVHMIRLAKLINGDNFINTSDIAI